MLVWIVPVLAVVVSVSSLPFQHIPHPDETLRSIFNTSSGSEKQAFATGNWYTNLFFFNRKRSKPKTLPVVSHPYFLVLSEPEPNVVQLQWSYPFRVLTKHQINEGFQSGQLSSSAVEPLQSEFHIVSQDSLSVVLQFDALDDTSNGFLRLFLVRGSPYITLEYQNLTPVISSSFPLTVHKQNQHFQVVNEWKKWLYFSSQPIEWGQQSDRIIKATNKFTGVLRLALCLSEEQESSLRKYSSTYPVGATIDYSTSATSVSSNSNVAKMIELSFQWKVKSLYNENNGTEELLMLALTHHFQSFQSVRRASPVVRYMGMKGEMIGVIGDRWILEEPLIVNLPWYTKPSGDANVDSSIQTTKSKKKEAVFLQKILKEDMEGSLRIKYADDVYTFGKEVARDARLILIASKNHEDLGNQENNAYVQKLLGKMKSSLALWLQGKNRDYFVFDSTFGGLVTQEGIHNQDRDYGNGYYNDHHFQYGYLVYAIAVVGKFEPSFLETHGTAIKCIVNDIGYNPKSELGNASTYFWPIARHKDWYNGHSYASGLFEMANSKSQESSSESVNAYYALSLLFTLPYFQENTSDSIFMQLLLQMEIRSVQSYWHMYSRPGEYIYEPDFIKRNRMVGVLSELSAVCETWFGRKIGFVHGINLIPFTPITPVLFNLSYVAVQYPLLASSFENDSSVELNIWKLYSYMELSMLDSHKAWNSIQPLLTDTSYFDAGNSRSNALDFVLSNHFHSKSLLNIHVEDVGKICFGNAGCGALGLGCCDILPGCCSQSPKLGCCSQPALNSKEGKSYQAPNSHKIQTNETCHNQHKCAVAGSNKTPLGCCATEKGCCPGLACCLSDSSVLTISPPLSIPPSISKIGKIIPNMSTTRTINSCQDNPKCLTAGENQSALACCFTKHGCCPGLLCCTNSKSIKQKTNSISKPSFSPTRSPSSSRSLIRRVVLVSCILGLIFGCFLVAIIVKTWRKRNQYQAIGSNGGINNETTHCFNQRSCGCLIALLFIAAMFLFLIISTSV